MPQVFSSKTLLSTTFSTLKLSEEWTRIIGEPDRNFRMIVWGESGSGKTTFVLKLVGELQKYGKVFYNSIEQGFTKSLQANIETSNITPTDNIMFGDRLNYEEMIERLRTNQARFVVIDSIQYLNFTKKQYQELKRLFRKKAFIFISHAQGQQPKGQAAKDIRYDVDIKVQIIAGVTSVQSRFGQTEPYHIFENQFLKRRKTDLKLF